MQSAFELNLKKAFEVGVMKYDYVILKEALSIAKITAETFSKPSHSVGKRSKATILLM